MIQIETLRPAPELAELLTRPGDPSISPEVRATRISGTCWSSRPGSPRSVSRRMAIYAWFVRY